MAKRLQRVLIANRGEIAVRVIRTLREWSSLPVIVLSGSEDVDLMRSLMEIGVLGFIPKAYSPEVMLSAIRLVMAGGIYIPPLLLANAQAQGWHPALDHRGAGPAGETGKAAHPHAAVPQV